MMCAEILSVGDEVVSGHVADTNAAWLSQRLLERGLVVVAHAAVRDVREEIAGAVRRAAHRADVVVVTGGLGPTHDDVTREAVAGVAGAELVPDAPSLEHIREVFAARGAEVPPSNAKQAQVPRGSDPLRNSLGTAAGFRVRIDGASVFVLPGVPAEMKAMFEEGVVPLLPAGEGTVVVRALQCFGVPESVVAETLAETIDLDGEPRVAFLVSGGVICVKFTAWGPTPEAARAVIGPVFEKARAALGENVFGEDDDTLEAVVARRLEARGWTLAVAESCTGGLVGHRLTNVPGISAWFIEGVVAYSNGAKTRLLGVPPAVFEAAGAVSEEVARAMAEGVRERAGADVGVGITGIAGPTGGSPEKPVGTVHVAVATADGTAPRRLRLRGTRMQIKDRAAKHALDLVRRVLGEGGAANVGG